METKKKSSAGTAATSKHAVSDTTRKKLSDHAKHEARDARGRFTAKAQPAKNKKTNTPGKQGMSECDVIVIETIEFDL